MTKIFKKQRFFMTIFTIVSLAVFVYALAFMTQYRGMLGLKLKQNSGIADFYENTLQNFNKFIFIAALIGLLIVLISYFLEINTKVPDKFGLIVMGVLLGICATLAAFFIVRISMIMTEYTGLDFSFAPLEGLKDTSLKMETFYIGYALYAIVIIQNILYFKCLYKSHKTFLSEKEGVSD